MAVSRTLLHVNGGTSRDPPAAIRLANRLIYVDGRSSMFATVFYGAWVPFTPAAAGSETTPLPDAVALKRVNNTTTHTSPKLNTRITLQR